MFNISFVIPCKNEEMNISRCIDSIIGQTTENENKEIVVVDNGSTDKTIEILNKYKNNLKLFVLPNVSISELRNFGVKNTKNEWIAFIDADVELCNNWFCVVIKFIEKLSNDGVDIDNIITGSTCKVPFNSSWIEQVWYDQLVLRDENNLKYINSGNMIISRKLFQRLGGFDISYKTGEEENLCKKARKSFGTVVIKNNKIEAIHHGYPKNLKSFFKRMRWHGSGMIQYLLKPWESKPLLLAYYNMILTFLFIIAQFFFEDYLSTTVVYITLLILPPFFLAINRYKRKFVKALQLSMLYFCFGWARVFSIFDYIRGRQIYDHK